MAGIADDTAELGNGLRAPAPLSPLHRIESDIAAIVDPWRPIVLSLDGGGIRGLSTLFILRRIMLRIQQLEREFLSTAAARDTSLEQAPTGAEDAVQSDALALPEMAQRRVGDTTLLPLPCHYFDYIVGTSTGGLIAVMLGRLRMNIDKVIQQYLVFGDKVFGKPRWWRWTKYNAANLERVVKNVVAENCTAQHPGPCNGEELLRQKDHAHHGNRETQAIQNGTCRVVLVALRKSGRNSNVQDVVYLFRSYDHPRVGSSVEHNPGYADDTTIWEAARATSAAPLYFETIEINGLVHMDGAVGHNNPSKLAWNEAIQMIHPRRDIGFFLSVGTGRSQSQSRFGSAFGGVLRLMKWMRKNVTETEAAHGDMIAITNQITPYERLTVDRGLERMRLDEWKRAKRSRTLPTDASSRVNSLPQMNGTAVAPSATRTPTQTTSVLPPLECIGNSIDTANWRYLTLEAIWSQTEAYCNQNTDTHMSTDNTAKIDRCARKLFAYAQARARSSPDKWMQFITDPHVFHCANEDTA